MPIKIGKFSFGLQKEERKKITSLKHIVLIGLTAIIFDMFLLTPILSLITTYTGLDNSALRTGLIAIIATYISVFIVPDNF